MHTGERVMSRPSLGAWVTYGLGTENRNLPGFVALGPGPIIEGARQYGASFLPAAYQGTFVSNFDQPLKNLAGPEQRDQQRRALNTLARLNELCDGLTEAALRARIGRTVEVLDENGGYGRARDGFRVKWGTPAEPGRLRKVRIVGTMKRTLLGECQ